MPFNNYQVEKIPKALGLSYRWIHPDRGASEIIVEETISYKPFSNKLKNILTNQSYSSNTFNIFEKLCQDLAKPK